MAGSCNDRIVVLIDMDCFFCQVETRLRPEYQGKPLAVVQYNQWQLGGLIAVNYEARDYGVTRHMRGEEAKEKCPDIILASVPCLRGKSDTSRYRSAGREVINVIRKHCNIIERASVDEAYLDITDIVDKRLSSGSYTSSKLASSLSNTFVVGYSEVGNNDEEQRRKGMRTWLSNVFDELEDVQAQKLAIAGVIVEEIRADIYDKTGFRCSAGIAQNKILSKLACGLHKPNRQTILPAAAVSSLYSTLPVKKVRNLGGKFGDVVVESLNCNVMGDLLQFSLQYLQKRFDDKTGLWLYNIARGVDNEPVTTRLVSKSIGACKKFPGKQAIVKLDVLQHWLGELSAEVCERLEQDLEENERRATLITLCYHYYQNRNTISQSRSCALTSYKPEKMASKCVDIITKSTQCPIAYLGISAGKFIPAKGSGNFMNFFKTNNVQDLKVNSESHKKSEVYPSNNINQVEISNSKVEGGTSAIMNTEKQSNLKNVELNLNMEKENITKTRKTCVQVSENARGTSFRKTDDSPTSRKVNILINSLNNRNSAKVLYKNAVNKGDLNESLDQEKFKGSFFMNILNHKEKKYTYDDCIDKAELVDFDENVSKSEYDSSNFAKDHGKNSDIEKYKNAASTINCEEKDDSEKVCGEEYDYRRPSTSHKIAETHSNNDTCVNKTDCLSAQLGENHNAIIKQSSSVRLQEIFPDLNNIDPTVLSLLPLDLQEEAKLHMNVQSKSTVKVKDNLSKNHKKNNKSKVNGPKGKKKNDMYTFLVKGNSCKTSNVPLKQCTQCSQMIAETKYNEHCDFHIAEALQRQLNDPSFNNTGFKRKSDASDTDENTIKRRPNINDCKSDKNCQLITEFLS